MNAMGLMQASDDHLILKINKQHFWKLDDKQIFYE